MQLASVADAELGRLRAYVAAALPDFLADLAALVGIDCGSYTKTGVDQVGRWTAAALRRLGADVDVAPNRDLGDSRTAAWATPSSAHCAAWARQAS